MGGRGNNRGRGRGGLFKPGQNIERTSIRSRLGQVTFHNNTAKKYKFVRPTMTSSLAPSANEAEIKSLCKNFIKLYYETFDRSGRPNLESQYNADAFFSFSSTHPMPTIGRNLIEVQEPENRVSLLVHNKINIARALATFPPTEHNIDQLSFDVPFYIVNTLSVTSLQIIVNGVFKDLTETANPLRAFTRVFVLKQVSVTDQGSPIFEIYNDLFMLQQATPDQIKRYHQDQQIKNRISGNKNERTSASGDNSNNRQLIQRVMRITKMNEEGSKQLLTDCLWDEEKSIQVFNELFGRGEIPQKYFTP